MQTTIASWRAATEAGDADALADCLAADAVFISPLTEQFRFHGREQITDVLRSAFELLEDMHCHTQTGDEGTYALFFRARVGSQPVEEAQLLRLDDAGLIGEITLFGRPLPALTAVMAGIGPKMLRRQGKPGLGLFVGAAIRPLAAMTRFGEKRIVPLGDPNKA